MKTIFTFVVCVLATYTLHAQIGIGTTTPNSTLDVRGSLSIAVTTFSANTTAGASDNMFLFNGVSAATLTLPTAVGITGRVYWVKNISSNSSTLTIATTSAQTIDGLGSWTLTQTNKAIRLISNGSNWYAASESLPGSTGNPWTLGGNNVSSLQNLGTTSNYDLPFITNNTEKMRLDVSGKLGIGVTPSYLLHVRSVAGGGSAVVARFEGTQSAGGSLQFQLINNSASNSKTFFTFGGSALGKQWALGNDLAANNTQDFYIYDFNAFATRFYINGSGNTAIGSTTFNATNPEKLLVDAGTVTDSSFQNVIVGKGNTNNYAQLNIQNGGTGSKASSDVVATSNNGNESINYIDMGINGGGNTSTGVLGGANTAYLYSTGNDFAIGNGTDLKNLDFFTNAGGTNTERMRITSAGYVGINTNTPNSILDVRGSLSVPVTTFSANTTAGASDNLFLFNGASPATLTLPTAVGITGRIYWIKNISANSSVLTIATTSSQTIDGLSSWSLTQTNKVIRLVSNGTNWYVAAESLPGTNSTSWSITGNSGINPISNFIGTSDNKSLRFRTNNKERIYVDSATGYIGINTTNTMGILNIVSDGTDEGNNYWLDDYTNSTNRQSFQLRKARGTVTSPINLVNGDLIGVFRMNGYNNGGFTSQGGSGMDVYYKGSGMNDLSDLRLMTNDTERMRLDEFGSVGIGASAFTTANPERLLVNAAPNVSGAFQNVIVGKGNTNSYAQLNIQNTYSGGLTPNIVSSDVVATANNGSESVNFIDMGINGGSNTSTGVIGGANTAYLYSMGNDLAIGNGTSSKDIIFFTSNSFTERMRILSNGAICIGTSTQNGTNKLTVNGSIAATAFNVSSDRRLKTGIRSTHYGLKEIMNLQPVSWNWKDNSAGAGRQLGLIAQDTKEVIPEIVSGNEQTGTLSINYTELIPVLINAIKEQQKQIDDLKKKINILERK